MLSNLGIKGRVLLLTLVPSGMFAGLLGAWFSYSQLNDLEQQLLQRGELILNQLAQASAESLAQGKNEQLMRIAQDAIEFKDVRSIRIVAAPNRVIVHNGPSMRLQDFSAISTLTTLSTEASSQLITPFYPPAASSAEGALADSKLQSPMGWISLELSHHASLLEGYRSVFITISIILIGLLITALLALRLSRTINIPLENIKKGVARIRDGTTLIRASIHPVAMS